MQSGLADPGSVGVLVGGGSLGSAILDLWGRSGWGQWTVIDKDHIRPHNLVRHVAYAQHVGQPKAHVLAQLHNAVADGASRVIPICADVLAEQVRRAATREAATIRVWSRAPDSGAVAMYEVPVSNDRSVRISDLSVFIDAGLEGALNTKF